MTTTPDRPLAEHTDAELADLVAALRDEHARVAAQGLALDLTRGKPSSAQLDLANDLLHGPDGFRSADGTDLRNYGGAAGITELRAIFAELLNEPVRNVLALGNSSLELMYDALVACLLTGVGGGEPWRDQAVRAGRPIRMIAVVPGYDRHFAMCAKLGIELVCVELGEHGPDVNEVARLAEDPLVKGIWVVPTYSNPSGVSYDEPTTRALLALPAADDFRIFWDNAYAVHHLTDAEPEPLPVLELAAEAGHPDRVFEFASTSKISFAGAGVAAFAGSEAGVAWFLDNAGARTIGPDKLNQLRHAQFFGDAAGVRAHLAKHRALLQPKFAAVEEILSRRLGRAQVASWTRPTGGYFVSLDVADGTATRVVDLAERAGVALTPAGSAFPGGVDPRDRNIRLAPSFPPLVELSTALDVVATCVLLAAAEAEAERREEAHAS